MSKINPLRRLKAALLAGTMAASLSACTKEEETDLQNSLDAARYEQEESTRTTASENNTLETKTTTVEEKTKENATEENTEEKTTNNNGEVVTTEFVQKTTSKNNNTTSNNTTKNNTTTPVVTQTPVTTKQQVTTKATTTTAVQTQAPTTTAAPVTTTPIAVKQNYTKYDLLDSDPEVAAQAFKQLSEELRKELFKGYYVSDESYGMTAGYEQSKIILAALNYYNGGISPETLAHNDALGKLSKEDMEKYCINLDLPQEQYLYGSRVDFNKYVIDDDFADEIESITDKYFDWKDNGNLETLEETINVYSKNNNYDCLENVNNFMEFYYMCSINLEYKNQYHLIDTPKQTLREYLIIPMYESYEQYIGKTHSR